MIYNVYGIEIKGGRAGKKKGKKMENRIKWESSRPGKYDWKGTDEEGKERVLEIVRDGELKEYVLRVDGELVRDERGKVRSWFILESCKRMGERICFRELNERKGRNKEVKSLEEIKDELRKEIMELLKKEGKLKEDEEVVEEEVK